MPSTLPGVPDIDDQLASGIVERLATIEHRVLGVVREDDLPGSEAPAAWLSYLRGGSAEKLRRVGHHNAQDLRSLTGLLAHFVQLADEQGVCSDECGGARRGVIKGR